MFGSNGSRYSYGLLKWIAKAQKQLLKDVFWKIQGIILPQIIFFTVSAKTDIQVLESLCLFNENVLLEIIP